MRTNYSYETKNDIKKEIEIVDNKTIKINKTGFLKCRELQ